MLFLPWTSLAYVVAWIPIEGVSPLGWFVVLMGFALDIATYSSRSIQNRFVAEAV
jgi:hypothetical protein